MNYDDFFGLAKGVLTASPTAIISRQAKDLEKRVDQCLKLAHKYLSSGRTGVRKMNR